MANKADALRKTVNEQDNKLKEYAQQLERYLEMLNKERGRKQELEEIVLKQVEETRAMMKLTTSNGPSMDEMKTDDSSKDKKSGAGVMTERMQIAQSLEQCQVIY